MKISRLFIKLFAAFWLATSASKLICAAAKSQRLTAWRQPSWCRALSRPYWNIVTRLRSSASPPAASRAASRSAWQASISAGVQKAWTPWKLPAWTGVAT